MKKVRKVLFIAAIAAVLALCALGVTACGGSSSEDSTPKSEYTLTFIVGTAPYETVTALEGSTYELKESPTRPNYVFDGWSLTPNGSVAELPDVMPSEHRTYYAVFSARYNLNLNAGIGTLPDSQKTMSVKSGAELYGLLSGVVPTVSDSDAVFAGWFLRGSEEITATSGQKMPSGNAEVVAKYSVAYTVNVYKETDFGKDNYDGEPVAINGTAYVGEKVTDLPSYSGYYCDTAKDNSVLNTDLDKNSAQNTFSLYYKIIGYDIIFNANLPSEVTYDGEMETKTFGYGIQDEVPSCGFNADGYRFLGWATTPDGEIEYYPRDNYTAERNTTFYAKWVRGLTELAGLSSDRVYVMKDTETHTDTVAYLERSGLADISGDYNTATGVFTFKSKTTAQVLLRGIADIERNTYTYLNTSDATRYMLRKLDGTTDETVSLSLSDDGNAVYAEGSVKYSGKYSVGSDGSMEFKATDKEFAFRLVRSEGSAFAEFMIRGVEYGTWNNITQARVVDLMYTLDLDGYGTATMHVTGLNSSLTQQVMSSFGGMYVYSDNQDVVTGDNHVAEIIVTLFNDSLQARRFACLLTTGLYRAANDSTIYPKVFLERFVTTLYGAPASGEKLDKDTADKIELSGYSILKDSATYTYTDNEGAHTVKGRYAYDNTVGTLSISPTSNSKDDLLFEVSMSDDEQDPVPLFEPVEELFGQYLVAGLDSAYGPQGFYTFHIYNNNVAAFAFMIPVSDSFYGNILYEYTRLMFGEYEIAEYGADGDDRANVYEYTATVDPYVVSYIYSLYGSLGGTPLDVRQLSNFRFQFVYSDQTGGILYVNTTVASDFREGCTLTYDGVEYTLDGFGTAVGTDAGGEELRKSYTYNTRIGIGVVLLVPDASAPTETVMFIDARKNNNYVQYSTDYVTNNAGTTFDVIFFEDDTALLCLMGTSGMSRVYYSFSYGNVTWDAGRTYGRFVRDESVEFSDIYRALGITYADFKFSIITATETNSKGEEVEVSRLYVYEANESDVGADGEFVLVNESGDKLTIHRNGSAAEFVRKGKDGAEDTVYSGMFRYFDGKVQVLYYATPEAENYSALTFELEYDSEGDIQSFREIAVEAGYYVSADDGKSYMYLTGVQTDETGVYAGTYYEYDDESADFTERRGTYRANYERSGLDFTYATGDTDDEGQPVTETFTFALGIDVTGIPYYREYSMELGNTTVLYLVASVGQPLGVGTLSGGGYSAQTFTFLQTQYSGKFVWSDEASAFEFTATTGDKFYFRSVSGMGVFLLDSTFMAENRGMYELSEAIDVDVAATEGTPAEGDTPAVEAVPAHTAHVTRIEMTGMALAYLHYDYRGEDKTVAGMYVQYATNGFAFVMLSTDAEDELLSFRFRLVSGTDEETGDATYTAELAEADYLGTYESDDLTVINLNGFDFAYYVDSYGRVFGGVFAVSASDPELIRITYIDTLDYTVNYVYVKLDTENRTFTEAEEPEQFVAA